MYVIKKFSYILKESNYVDINKLLGYCKCSKYIKKMNAL